MPAVIFDMYGVILPDPEGGLLPFVQRSFPHYGYEDVYRHWRQGNIGALSSRGFFAKLGYQGDLAALEKEYLDSIAIDTGFYQVAARLQPYYQLAMVSNDLAEWSRYLQDKFSLGRYLSVAVVSGEQGIKKPDPRLYQLALQRLQLPAADCAYVDDRRENLDAAAALGMRPILFNSRHIAYEGQIVNSFAELQQLLLG